MALTGVFLRLAFWNIFGFEEEVVQLIFPGSRGSDDFVGELNSEKELVSFPEIRIQSPGKMQRVRNRQIHFYFENVSRDADRSSRHIPIFPSSKQEHNSQPPRSPIAAFQGVLDRGKILQRFTHLLSAWERQMTRVQKLNSFSRFFWIREFSLEKRPT